MTGWVEEHSERLSRLFGGFARTDLEHGFLGHVEVVDHDVEVHLLRVGLTGQLGAWYSSTCWMRSAARSWRRLRPRAVLVDGDRPSGAFRRTREFTGVRSVEHDNGRLCDSHGPSLRRRTDTAKDPR